MARRRRTDLKPKLSGGPSPEVPVTAADRLDPRVCLVAPDDVAWDPERLLAWAQLHHPSAVFSDESALDRARIRHARAARIESGNTPTAGRPDDVPAPKEH